MISIVTYHAVRVPTLLLGPDAFHNDEDLRISHVVASINEVLEGHETIQRDSFTESQRSLEHSIVAVLVDHDVAIAVALREEGGEERCTCAGQRSVLAIANCTLSVSCTPLPHVASSALTYCDWSI